MKKVHLAFIFAIGWFIISTILLTLPGTDFPKEDWLDIIWFDKWVHIGMFAVMVLLWCISWKFLKINATAEKLKRIFIITGLAWLSYGIAMEFVQKYFIPFRSFDVGDILADATGCAVGVMFCIRRFVKK